MYNVKAGPHESSSGPRGVDPYKECPMHCGIPNNGSEVQSSVCVFIYIYIYRVFHDLRTLLQQVISRS